MFAVANPPTNPLTEAATAAFLDLRRRLRALADRRTHGATTFQLDAAGVLIETEDVETFRQDAGEDLDGFLIRVWAQYRMDQRAAITWSQHEGRWSAKITRRSADDLRLLDVKLAQLGLQVGRLALYLEALERYGPDDGRARHVPLDA